MSAPPLARDGISLSASGNASMHEQSDEHGPVRFSDILKVLVASGLPPARVTSVADGGIAVSFVDGSNRAVIEIYNDGEIAAATYSDQGGPTVWELDDADSQLVETVARIVRHFS